MPAIGGSIQAVSLKGRLFPVAADADANRNIGGFTNEVQANGDGSARIIMLRVPWKVSGIALEIDDDRGDQEFLQEIVALKDWVACTVELASGTVYRGRGTITEDVEMSTMNTTAPLSLSGPQKLEPQ